MAGSKNAQVNKKPTEHVNLKLTSDCEKCIQTTGGCDKGKTYVHNVTVLKKAGKGCVCSKPK